MGPISAAFTKAVVLSSGTVALISAATGASLTPVTVMVAVFCVVVVPSETS